MLGISFVFKAGFLCYKKNLRSTTYELTPGYPNSQITLYLENSYPQDLDVKLANVNHGGKMFLIALSTFK